MEYFYDGQIRRYLTQFMRLMSNFAYKDGKGKIVQIPVRYGDMNRQVAQIMTKNSENIVQSAPFIACYIKNMEFARERLQDPTYVSKINIRERAFDEQGQEYLNMQGSNYTVERLMPTPFNLEFNADIWTTNTDQKFQILEQLLVLFNPSMEIQTSNNYIDWTSLSTIELTNLLFTSRSVPQGLEQDIDIATMTFKAPIWITTPAKVKKLGIITQIVTNVFNDQPGTVASKTYEDSQSTDHFSGRTATSVGRKTLGNLGILVLDNTAKLTHASESFASTASNYINIGIPNKLDTEINWNTILNLYPGKFTAGLSQIRLAKPDDSEIVGFISLDPTDDFVMHINWDDETLYANTLIDVNGLRSAPDGTLPPGFDYATGVGRVDAIIDPLSFNPRQYLSNGGLDWPALNVRYLILENINHVPQFGEPDYDGPDAWKNFDGTDAQFTANSIIQWDGEQWRIVFDTAVTQDITYITNSRTGVQYSWDGEQWMKSFEGVYKAGKWRLVL